MDEFPLERGSIHTPSIIIVMIEENSILSSFSGSNMSMMNKDIGEQ
jgi:hypothetical protein